MKIVSFEELTAIPPEKSWWHIALPVGVAAIGGGAAVILLRRRKKKAAAANSENGTLAEE